MTQEEKLNVCLREMSGGNSFLADYAQKLSALYADAGFRTIIDQLSQVVSEEIIFSADVEDQTFQTFKTQTLFDYFKDKNALSYTCYADIVNCLVERGAAKVTGAIYTYYAMRYFELSGECPEAFNLPDVAENLHDDDSFDSPKQLSFHGIYQSAGDGRWFRCDDGHHVRSKNEALVDNWLYYHGICHAHDKPVYGTPCFCDFYIPETDTYIEVWGKENDPDYTAHKEKKQKVYREKQISLLEIDPVTIQVLDDFMAQKFFKGSAS